jgi:hypothetical protein
MDKARIWLEPFDPKIDQLSMDGGDYKHNLVGNATETGSLEIVQPGGPQLTKKDWNDVINLPTYRMNINVIFAILLQCCLILLCVSTDQNSKCV